MDQALDVRASFVSGIDVRDGQDGQPTSLGGYAAVFNQETIITGPNSVRWRERIAPAAFRDAIGRDDVVAAVNHDHKYLLGRTSARTLTLKADAHGLRYDVSLPNTSVAHDTVEQVRRGDLAGSSFRFSVPDGGLRIAKPAGVSPDDLPLVIIERVKLIDVGPVTWPAYEGTSVSVRSVPELVAASYQEAADQVVALPPSTLSRQKARIAIEQAKAWAP